MKKEIKNIEHSIHQKLLNKAHETKQSFNFILQHYAIERFLYRISKSKYVKKLFLKGALLLKMWNIPSERPTMDIDLLGKIDANKDNVKRVIKDCMSIKVKADGLEFYPESIEAETITEDAEYQGVRVKFRASLGNAKINLQVDIGIGDEISPEPLLIDYPTILGGDNPHLKAYTLESAIAEKYQAMIVLELANSRMKDFYDIWLLANHLSFDGKKLANAIKTTFSKRNTDVPNNLPFCFSDQFYNNEIKQTQWKAFTDKLELKKVNSLEKTVKIMKNFLMPVSMAVSKKETFKKRWNPKGDWK